MSYFDDVVEPALYESPNRHRPKAIKTKHLDEFGDPVVWTTQSGSKLILEDMDINHLKNCRNLLHRRRMDITFPNLHGEMAQEHAEQEYESMQEHFIYIINCFDNEIKRKEDE